MIKTLMISAALLAGATTLASAETTVLTGRSIAMHHHHHMRMHMRHRMMHRSMSYGVGGDGRTTATGGNAGGYSSKN